MEALRFIQKIEGNTITQDELLKYLAQEVEVIVFPVSKSQGQGVRGGPTSGKYEERHRRTPVPGRAPFRMGYLMRYLFDTNAVIYFLEGRWSLPDFDEVDELLLSCISSISPRGR